MKRLRKAKKIKEASKRSYGAYGYKFRQIKHKPGLFAVESGYTIDNNLKVFGIFSKSIFEFENGSEFQPYADYDGFLTEQGVSDLFNISPEEARIKKQPSSLLKKTHPDKIFDNKTLYNFHDVFY